MSEGLKIFKIGGGIIDDDAHLQQFLRELAQVPGRKLLVHGGGKGASQMLRDLGQEPQMVQGRRITDAATLDIVTMFYAGKTNKQVVAGLQAAGIIAAGMVPKLDNAFAALEAGVERVVIEHALRINEPVKTVLCQR